MSGAQLSAVEASTHRVASDVERWIDDQVRSFEFPLAKAIAIASQCHSIVWDVVPGTSVRVVHAEIGAGLLGTGLRRSWSYEQCGGAFQEGSTSGCHGFAVSLSGG